MSRFCTKCGAPLQPGMRFCTACGAAIVSHADQDTSGIDKMTFDVERDVSNIAPAAQAQPTQPAIGAPVAPTRQMPVVSDAPNAYVPQPPQKKGLSPVAKAGIIAAIIAVIGAAVALVTVLHPWDMAASSPSSASAASSSSSSSTSSGSSSQESATAQESSSATLSDAQIKSTLTSTLSQIDAFNTRVANTATDYNNHITGSSTERQNGYNNASALIKEIEDAIASTNALQISSSSRYYHAWTLEKRLLDDLHHRIYVMQMGWQRSLSSNDTDYINEYIAADNVNGVNRYKADYDETRSQISIPD